MDIVIIGAGASGLVASIFAKSKDNNVTVLERYEKSGKKILVTGNGRCNYWNDDFDNKHFYSNDSEFIKEVNTLENQKKVLAFFESIGINPTIKNTITKIKIIEKEVDFCNPRKLTISFPE